MFALSDRAAALSEARRLDAPAVAAPVRLTPPELSDELRPIDAIVLFSCLPRIRALAGK